MFIARDELLSSLIYFTGGSSHGTSPGLLSVYVVDVHVPGVGHHQFKVFVVVNAAGHVVVVFNPFMGSYCTVLGITTIVVHALAVVLLKGVEELEENFVFSPLSRNDIRVLGRVVNASDVVNVDCAGLVFIHNSKGLHGDPFAEIVHLTNNAS